MSICCETQSAPARRTIEERNALATEHLNLVSFVIRRHFRRQVAAGLRDDLHSAGVFGLLRAAEHFDETRGVRFSTYAVTAILRFMVREVRLSRTIRLPAHPVGTPPTALESLTGARGDQRELIDGGATDPADACQASELSDAVAAALASLPPLWADVLRLREAGESCRAVGRALGISEGRVARIEEKARAAIKEDPRLAELAR